MALVDVGSDMTRRANVRGLTYLHSLGFDIAHQNYQQSMRTSAGPNFSRSWHFHDAIQAHEQGISKGIQQQKIPARGVVRERIEPKTTPQMKQMGSLN